MYLDTLCISLESYGGNNTGFYWSMISQRFSVEHSKNAELPGQILPLIKQLHNVHQIKCILCDNSKEK